MIFLNFLEDIKNIIDVSKLDKTLISLAIVPLFSGKNPKKKNYPTKPLIEAANETEDAPGKGITSILFFMHSLIRIFPGSEIVGVPASQIKETTDPFIRMFRSFNKFFFSLNL